MLKHRETVISVNGDPTPPSTPVSRGLSLPDSTDLELELSSTPRARERAPTWVDAVPRASPSDTITAQKGCGGGTEANVDANAAVRGRPPPPRVPLC